MSDQRSKGIIYILVGASMWGASGIAVQYLFEYKHLTPQWLFMIRNIIAGLAFLAYAKYQGADLKLIWQEKKALRDLVIFGLVGLLPTQYCYMKTIENSNAATATVIQYLMPVILVGYYLWRTHRWPDKSELLSVALAMVGTYLLVTKGDGANLAISPAAFTWGIASAFAAAVYTVAPLNIIKKYSSPVVLGWSMSLNGLFANIGMDVWPFAGIMDIGTVLGLLVLVLFGTFLAFYFYLESTKYIPSTEVGALSSMEPLTSVLLAILLLHVRLSFIEIIGMLCIISTVIILARKK